MARSPPAQTFGYAPITPNFYYDDAEEYVGDFSENDALSEGAPRLLTTPNVTEIYRRKPPVAVGPGHERFRQQNMYIPPDYYYDALAPPVPQQMRRSAVSTTYRRHIPMVDERPRYYSTGGIENGYSREPTVYSSPQIATAVRRPATHPGVPVQRQVVRRHPVTVRTPRYYRRTVSNIYKKPSTLCLPVSCQPDPAVYRRRKHSDEQPPFNPQQVSRPQSTNAAEGIPRSHSVPLASASNENQQQDANPLDFPELHMTKSDVDAVLARYETILGDHRSVDTPAHGAGSYSSKSSKISKISKNKLISQMQPKVPSSIKQRQERLQKMHDHSTSPSKTGSDKHKVKSKSKDHVVVEEITTDVLDSMLSELMDSACASKINQQKMGDCPKDIENISRKTDYSEGSSKQRPPSSSQKDKMPQYPKSFNYQDISQNMSKPDESSRSCSVATTPRYEPRNCSFTSSNMRPPNKPPTRNCTPVDENSAMELHRSKSYIVSLIDRALSKELGTIPTQKLPPVNPTAPPSPPASPPTSKENDHINARQAMDLMNKNMDKMDKGLCLEITQALTDSIVANATAPCQFIQQQQPQQLQPPPIIPELNHSGSCTCNVQDEPLYVKQLKQLRWGHLRHIQREVRRLEDLERFLDSCSSGSCN